MRLMGKKPAGCYRQCSGVKPDEHCPQSRKLDSAERKLRMFDNLRADIASVMERDPAAKSKWEVLLKSEAKRS